MAKLGELPRSHPIVEAARVRQPALTMNSVDVRGPILSWINVNVVISPCTPLQTVYTSVRFGGRTLQGSKISDVAQNDVKTAAAELSEGLLFHQRWWLDAATAGNWVETTVASDGKTVARLPFVIKRKFGLTRVRMPPFTHVLGPDVTPSAGKPQTQFARGVSLVRDLIDQLPQFAECKMAFESQEHGLAFQSRGFEVRAQYTFRIPVRDSEAVWQGMNYRLRQNIRRAEEKFDVDGLDDAKEFVRFYEANLRSRGLQNTLPLANFQNLFEAATRRGAGEILCARWADRSPTAMIFTVWDAKTTYYLLSTRAAHGGDNGSICLLLWAAIKRSQKRGAVFDFDGVSTSGTAKFYSQFGGDLHMRLIAYRASPLFAALAAAKGHMSRPEEDRQDAFV